MKKLVLWAFIPSLLLPSAAIAEPLSPTLQTTPRRDFAATGVGGICKAGVSHGLICGAIADTTSAPNSPPEAKRYLEAHEIELKKVADYDLTRIGLTGQRPEFIHRDVVAAWEQMQQAAQKDGVSLGIGSGFRSLADQEAIWARKHAEGQTDAQIALVNKKPGYSEHHTGYAIDIIDLNAPSSDFRNTFRETAAGQWLAQHATTYGFEKSYPHEDNNGIQLEEWHWRYIDSPQARDRLHLANSPETP